MKTKPETEFVLVRPKRDKATRASFSIIRNNEKLDLTDLVYLQDREGMVPLEEWVHKDDYQFYFNELHKHDDLKEWNGSEDQKEFMKETEQ